jgi:hypothetical protein
MADFVAEKVKEMEAEMRKLEPLVAEYNNLQEALASLGATSSSAGRVGRPAATKKPAAKKATGAKRGRPKGSVNKPATKAAAKKSAAKAAASKPATKAAAKKPATKSTGGKLGRPKGSGKRAGQAVSIITAEPGLKLSAVAERMKVKPNYLYRLLPELAKDGKVVKRDKAWFPA